MIHSDNDPYNILNAFDDMDGYDDALPIKSTPPKGGKEHRKSIRYKVSWRIVIAIKGHNLYDGRIKDISPHGAAILNERNLEPGTVMTLHIHIPALNGCGLSRIIKVRGNTSYTVHDNKHQCFRVGIAFVEFELASDSAYLEARLSSHHFEIL